MRPRIISPGKPPVTPQIIIKRPAPLASMASLQQQKLGPSIPQLKDTYPFFMDGKTLMKKNDKKDGPPIRVGRLIQVVGRHFDEDTKTFTVEIEYDYSGGENTISIGREYQIGRASCRERV